MYTNTHKIFHYKTKVIRGSYIKKNDEINVREYRKGNPKRTIQRNWQNRVNKMENNKTKTKHSKAQVKQIQTSRIKMAEQYKVKEWERASLHYSCLVDNNNSKIVFMQFLFKVWGSAPFAPSSYALDICHHLTISKVLIK